MKTKYSNEEALLLLQNADDDICISIIVPTHAMSPGRSTDHLQVQKAIITVKAILKDKYSQKKTTGLIQGLDQAYDSIDFTHNTNGIGIFVSGKINLLVPMFFPVTEKVFIGASFLIKDILYQQYFATPYWLLFLTGNAARLFNGSFNKLHPVNDIHFPMQYEDEYEYDLPSRGTSYVGHAYVKSFEKDKNNLQESHYDIFLHEVNKALDTYLINGSPLMLAGVDEVINQFDKISRKYVTAKIKGNYTYSPVSEIGNTAWLCMKQNFNNKKQMLLTELNETSQYVLTDVAEIWKAVKEGNGYKLFVEKDYTLPGFVLKDNGYRLELQQPYEPYFLLPDVTNSLVCMMLHKNGEVIITENKELQKYQRMALITRY